MLQQIILNTPLWVWALLAFLIYRGLASSVDREASLRNVFIIPAVLLVLSIQRIASSFGADPSAAPVWFACAVAATTFAWRFFDADSITAVPERQAVAMRGSWVPLLVMMGIFFTKYVVAVTLLMDPQLKQSALFVASICALYGLFNGIFIGRMLRIVGIYRQALATLPKLL